jgi:wobble nucleotide-excising tRNase
MMIKRIVEASNLLSYVRFKWDTVNLPIQGNDVSSFCKNNIIFAENGSGKSNLIKILVGLKLNGQIDQNWDMEGQPSKLVVSIRRERNEIEYDGTIWKNNVLQKKIIIFDSEYIDRYVHSTGRVSGSSGSRDSERGKNIVYLGNFGSHNDEIEKLIKVKDHLVKRTAEMKTRNAQAIMAITPDQINEANEIYKARQAVENADPNNLEEGKSELSKIVEARDKLALALKKKAQISALQLLSKIDNKPTLKVTRLKDGKPEQYEIDVQSLFEFSVSSAVKKALKAVEHKQHFVKEGTELLESNPEHCPFCEQSIEGLPLTDSYKEIFTEEFTNSDEAVQKELRAYKNLLGVLRDVQHPNLNMLRLVEAKKYIVIDSELNSISTNESEKVLINDEISRVDNKLAKSLEKIPGSTYIKLQKIVARIDHEIEKYNQTVANVNKIITKLKDDSSDGKIDEQINRLNDQINKLEISVFFMENKTELLRLIDVHIEIIKNDDIVASLERIYQATKDEIINLFKTFVDDYYKRISEYIASLSPKMGIFDVGGRSTFDRRNTASPAQCGFSIRINGEDKLDALSEGERQVIALAYFFTMLERMSDQEQMIVVLDDPITNFDAGKRKTTSLAIANVTAPFRQLFVFTCDPLFRTYLLKQIDNRNFYYIFSSAGSSIHYVPQNLEAITSSFELDFQNIENVLGTDENIVIYGQKLRFCLETKIKEQYFGYSKDSLSEMIEQVASNSGQKFADLLANKDTILEIYSYCNTGGLAHYPRDGSTSWNELKGKINQYTSLGL